ncbi:hypothetical protein UA08_00512 [Talaromyces atroroseus]|uniref:Uncharacterized protein n=1 Tax=Talaromyces atroroseus TaxID=1441469 RepID=A0A225ATD7_TALAT|nr:hypothetical protein UA08_00512 [Talaromyces atroroseus]OKL64210.1 hypothetical protein UA08_00512 [Talaromyces atroroseus]
MPPSAVIIRFCYTFVDMHNELDGCRLGIAQCLNGFAAMDSKRKGKILPKSLTRPRSASVDSPFANHDNSNDDLDIAYTFSHDYLKTDPAFSPAVVSGQKPYSITTAATSSPLEVTKELANSIVHPRRTLVQHFESKTAKSLSKATRPYITPQVDREFLAAHDALFDAERAAENEPSHRTRSRRRTTSGGSKRKDRQELDTKTMIKKEENRGRTAVENAPNQDLDQQQQQPPSTDAETQRRKVELLEAHRQSLAVAWITSRHLKCVRLAPSKVVSFPTFEDDKFVERNDNGEEAWWMGIRELYRWEKPWQTAFWYGVFSFLWYTQHVVGFLYVYIIFMVLKSRLYPMDVVSMRESLDRVLDRGAQAYRCGELVDRHGRDKWLHSLLDDIAPFLRLQLGDLANFLEILRNFYSWRNPSKTAATPFFFFSCLLVSVFADMEFCMKMFWFIAINTFFLSWPVSGRYPRYRHIVSPIRWVFWDIPSYPEWAIRFLQQHEILRRHEMNSQNLSHGSHTFSQRDHLTDEGDGNDEVFYDALESQKQSKQPEQANSNANYRSRDSTAAIVHSVYFTCYYHGHEGRLIVSSEGLRFVENPRLLRALNAPKKQKPRLNQKPQWSYSFGQLVQMTKQQTPAFSKLAGLDRNLGRLDLEFMVGEQGEGGSKTPSAGEIEAPYDTKTRIEKLDVARAERDEIFNLIVGWSRNCWQAAGVDK